MVQWLIVCAPNVGGSSSIPGQGIRPHVLQLQVRMPQLRPSTANEWNKYIKIRRMLRLWYALVSSVVTHFQSGSLKTLTFIHLLRNYICYYLERFKKQAKNKYDYTNTLSLKNTLGRQGPKQDLPLFCPALCNCAFLDCSGLLGGIQHETCYMADLFFSVFRKLDLIIPLIRANNSLT